MRIIAHRGASDEAPENSRRALRRAWAAGADGAEIDVRLTRDGHLALLHDANTWRTTGTDHYLRCLDVRRLRRLRLRARAPSASPEGVPLLADVLTLWPLDKLAFIEVKEGPSAVVALRRLRLPPRTFVLAFRPDTAQAVSTLGLRAHAMRLVGAGEDPNAVSDALIAGRYRALGLHASWLSSPHWQKWREIAAFLAVWTVDDTGTALQAREAGADFLVTNRPRHFAQVTAFAGKKVLPTLRNPAG